ncbi:hypothetical protein INR49_006434, partial [Caranx melampygus]
MQQEPQTQQRLRVQTQQRFKGRPDGGGTEQPGEVMEGSQQRVEANILLLGRTASASPSLCAALTVRFLTRRFIGEYGDIESVYSRVDTIDGQNICFNIWDSQFTQQQLQQLRGCRKLSSVPVLIVGNKRDLQQYRSVSSEEGRLLALSQRCGFFEVSAAETYHGALLVFHRLVDLVRETRALRKTSAGVRGIVRS